tara:strand:- start:117 stop:656 length:540 start_codon:yes stop_codon:yes gene_type:complete
MPYTKEQLESVDFYQDFVKDLQTDYLGRVEELKEDDFRRNGVLYSFEDIISTNGLEDSEIGQDTIYFNRIDETDISKMISSSETQYPQYVSTSLLEQTIDRNLSELSTSEFADTLPEGVVDGDVVTNDDFEDKRVYLIQNNQKKPFNDIGIFYAEYITAQVKTITVDELENIPEGEEVE